ncbi:MAG: hypothetical protein WD271_04360 [Acidimicrobiia bacterium]
MGGSAGLTIALAFALALVPFGLWTWWMVRADRSVRDARPASATDADVRPLPGPEPEPQVALVRLGSYCRVPGSIGFAPSGAALVCTASAPGAPPRWRRFQTAA